MNEFSKISVKREHGFLFPVLALFWIYFLNSVIRALDPPPPPHSLLPSFLLSSSSSRESVIETHYLSKFLSRANNTQQLKASVLKQIR